MNNQQKAMNMIGEQQNFILKSLRKTIDPDEAHDMMMDTAAENIGHCDNFEEFWKIMEPEGMREKHASTLWNDHIEERNMLSEI